MLYYLSTLSESHDHLGFLRLFAFVTFRAGGAALLSFLLAVVFGPFTVRMLKRLQVKQDVRQEDRKTDAPAADQKVDTPIMGGLLIMAAMLAGILLFARPDVNLVWVFVFALVGMSAIGFTDDFMKVRKLGKDGMPGKMKLALQIAVAAFAVLWLDASQTGDTNYVRSLMVPFYKEPLVAAMPLALALAFGVAVVVGASNAVNLADGMDGLAAGCTVVAAGTYAVFAYVCGHAGIASYLHIPYIPGCSEVVVIGAAMAGAALGFLWHNCYPASMWMGDTGSLALGGAVGLIAVLVKQELVLLIVGGVFVIEALSVILQVGYYKLTRRLTGQPKRLFLCAPIHIHFRRKGLNETKIVSRFYILAIVLAAVGLATLKIR